MTDADTRKSVLMMCAHEPSLDPRIRWEAEGAAARFDVTVLGFASEEGTDRSRLWRGCRAVLVDGQPRSAVAFLWRFKHALRFPSGLLCAALLILLSPALLAADLAARLLGSLLRHLAGGEGVRAATASRGNGAAKRLAARRSRFPARLYYVFNALRRRFSPAAVMFWGALAGLPTPPDVLHCNDLDTLLVGVLAKRRYGCRLIYDAHEFYPYSDPDIGWFDVAFFRFVERTLIRQADAVVTVNPLLADAMRQEYGLPAVHSVANAEPWTSRRPQPAASRLRQLAGGRIAFLFQGRFAPGRGIEEIIAEWQAVDGERAALFLRGPENLWQRQALALAEGLDLLDRSIYFLDPVAEDDLVPAAAEADVGVIPYRPLIVNDRLCCPNKLSQYLHAGLMVIANDLPFVRAILREAGAGLFYDSATRGTFSRAVRQVLDDPELLPRACANAARFARDRFNWQTEGENLYALYEPHPPIAAAVRTAPAAIASPAA